MKVLLDTNAYVELRRGNPAIVEIVRAAEGIFFSAIVAGELLYGFQHGSRCQQNVKELQTFLEQSFVAFLEVNLVTADRFGRIASGLRKKGKPIPSNDIWIAAHALECGADLVSFDQHFEQIDGLVWICPTH